MMGIRFSAPRILAFCVLALVWPFAPVQAADTQCSRSTIKFDYFPDGRIRVPVTVENRTLSFLLDTGGIGTTIEWQQARELGLPVRQSVQRISGVGGSLMNFYVSAENVSVGGLRIKSRPIFVEARNLVGADGTLASDILRDFDVEIDLAGGNLGLIPPGYCAVAATTVIAMDVARDGHVRFPVKVDGKTLIASLDTGSAVSLIGMRAAALLGIYPNSPGLALVSDTGRYQIYTYPFQMLDMGGVAVKKPQIAVASEGFIPGTDSDLVLGMDALRQLHFIIAYGEKRLFFLAGPAN